MGLADRYLTEEYRKIFNIMYARLNFELAFLNGGRLPKNKCSAIRGGIGDALLGRYCINNGKCESCSFSEECIIQHTMYTKMDEAFKPEFMMVGDSLGYIIDCDDLREELDKGESISFTLTLFGRTIVHAGIFIQAIKDLGAEGLGKNKAKFKIYDINSNGDSLLCNKSSNYPCDSGEYDLSRVIIESVSEYVGHRLFQIEARGYTGRIFTESPVSLKHNGSIMDHFDMAVWIKAVQRRIYMLDCYEGIDGEDAYNKELPVPALLEEEHQAVEIRRYSSRHDEKITFKGIEGWIQLGKMADETLPILLAGEVLHVGKQVSFGFGKYMVR